MAASEKAKSVLECSELFVTPNIINEIAEFPKEKVTACAANFAVKNATLHQTNADEIY